MTFVDLEKRIIQAKIVYYGPGLSGKTTNLKTIHESLQPDMRGKMATIATETERTLFFDFLPVKLKGPAQCSLQFLFFTVPGQSFYNYSRRAVLQGVDGIVFVADSAPDRQDANLDSWLNMQENLESYNRSLEEIPTVVQYNKRDLPDAVAVEEMRELLGAEGMQEYQAVSSKKLGVAATMRGILDLVIQKSV